MSIWDLCAEECAPPVAVHEKQPASVRPFEAEYVTGIPTYRGLQHRAQKPSGRYHLGNPEIIAENRERQVARFLETARLVEQDQPMPHSGVRTIHEGEFHATRKSV